MDPDAIAALAGNALVTVMVTDGFESVRHRVARLFGGGKPDAAIERRLDATRHQLTTADPSDTEQGRASLATQWQVRFADLLADHPDAAAELQALIAGIQARAPAVSGNVTNTISGDIVRGPVIMGRDFTNVTVESPPPAPE